MPFVELGEGVGTHQVIQVGERVTRTVGHVQMVAQYITATEAGNFFLLFAAPFTSENRQGRERNFRSIRALGARLVTGRGYGVQRI